MKTQIIIKLFRILLFKYIYIFVADKVSASWHILNTVYICYIHEKVIHIKIPFHQ